jgi:hypothetical protein
MQPKTIACALILCGRPSGRAYVGRGHGVNNAQVDDVRTPRKQAELQQLAKRIAAFKPTRIVFDPFIIFTVPLSRPLHYDRDYRVQFSLT